MGIKDIKYNIKEGVDDNECYNCNQWIWSNWKNGI